MTAGTVLRQLLDGDAPVVAPGAADGLSARLIEEAGFPAVYLGGGAMARSAGYPDVGLLQLAEVADRVEKVLDVIDVPLIVDADTGFGGLANLHRTARLLSRLGVAAFHVEDQVFPKRCGLLAGKEVVPTDEMCRRIEVARTALSGSDTLLIARTDAMSVEGFDAAFARARAYREAGADGLFFEGLSSRAQLEAVGRDIDGHKLLDLYPGPESPLPLAVDARPGVLAGLGFKLLVYPSDLQRVAIHAMRRALALLQRDGDTRAMAPDIVSMRERDAIVRTQHYLDLDAPARPGRPTEES